MANQEEDWDVADGLFIFSVTAPPSGKSGG